MLLQAEDRLYLHTADSLAYKQGDSLSVADSRQWQIVQVCYVFVLRLCSACCCIGLIVDTTWLPNC